VVGLVDMDQEGRPELWLRDARAGEPVWMNRDLYLVMRKDYRRGWWESS